MPLHSNHANANLQEQHLKRGSLAPPTFPAARSCCRRILRSPLLEEGFEGHRLQHQHCQHCLAFLIFEGDIARQDVASARAQLVLHPTSNLS